MSTFGRQDGFLAGAHDGGLVSKRVDALVAQFSRISSIPVYCTKSKEHVMTLGQITKDEHCLHCKREGVESDVYVTQAIPVPVLRAEDNDQDEDDTMSDSERKARGIARKDSRLGTVDPSGMLSSGTGLPKKPVTGEEAKKWASEEPQSFDTGADGPFQTKKNRRPWTGTR